LAFAAAAVLFAAVVSAADVQRVADLVGAVSVAGLCLILLPQPVALLVESHGWKLALRVIGCDVGFFPLLRVRIATEALSQSLPAGVLVGDSIKPYLLGKHCGLSVSEGVGALVARKYLLIASQAFYVLVIAPLGFDVLGRASRSLLGFTGLEWVAWAQGTALALAALGTAVFLRKSAVARGAFALLGKIPVRPLRRWLDASERRFSDTDRTVSRFFLAGFRRHALPALAFAASWLVETLETYVILRVLGADVGFVEVASIEILLTFVRHVAFVVPSGLGVQDLGYVAALAALGVPDAASLGAAFVVVKRAKELSWIAVGYALLAADEKREPVRPAAVGTSTA
jgi:uncharacterized protein (TIRG00374 family)